MPSSPELQKLLGIEKELVAHMLDICGLYQYMYANSKSAAQELHPICRLRMNESANLRPLFAVLAVLSLCWITMASLANNGEPVKHLKARSSAVTASRKHQSTGLASIGRWDR